MFSSDATFPASRRYYSYGVIVSDSSINARPYAAGDTPLYAVITPAPCTFFEQSPLLTERYVRDGVLQLATIARDLRAITSGQDVIAGSTAADHTLDAKIAAEVLAALAPYLAKTADPRDARADARTWKGLQSRLLRPRDIAGLRRLLTPEMYIALVAMLHLREEESFADLVLHNAISGDVFAALRDRLARFGVTPATSESFRKILRVHGSERLYARFERLFMATAQRGVRDGESPEALALLQTLVTYRTGDTLYASAQRFRPEFHNANHNPCEWFAPALVFSPVERREGAAWRDARVGYQLYCGLREFLVNQVEQGAEWEYQTITHHADASPNIAQTPTSAQTSARPTSQTPPPPTTPVTINHGEPIAIPTATLTALDRIDPRKPGTTVFADDRYIYLALRLPVPITEYNVSVAGIRKVATDLNVDGGSGTVARKWSEFLPVERADHAHEYLYIQRSPLYPWIRPGAYPFLNASIYLEHKRRRETSVIPIDGTAQIVESAAPMHCTFGRLIVDGDHVRIPLEIHNVMFEGAPLLILPNTVSGAIKISTGNDDQSMKITLEKTFTARRTRVTGDDAHYEIDLLLPPAYQPRGWNFANITTSITNRFGEPATLDSNVQPLETAAYSMFDEMRLTLSPGPMPLPWVVFSLTSTRPELLPILRESEYTFDVANGQSGQESNVALTMDPRWIESDLAHQRLLIPAVARGSAEAVLQRDNKLGSYINARSRMFLPIDPQHPEHTPRMENFWIAKVWWRAAFEIPSLPGYPDGDALLPTMEKTKIPPEVTLRDNTEAALDAFVKEGTQLRMVESSVRAGEDFHVELTLPDQPHRFEFQRFVTTPKEIAKMLEAHVRGATNIEHILASTSFVAVGPHRWRVTFTAPPILPAGKFSVELRAAFDCWARYLMHYAAPEGHETFTDAQNSQAFDMSHRWTFPEFFIEGDPNNPDMKSDGDTQKTRRQQ